MSGNVVAYGLGVRPADDATLESLQELEACDAVFSDVLDPASRRWLSALLPETRFDASPADVLGAAAKGRVGLAVWGHPHHVSAFARAVAASCRTRKIPFSTKATNSPLGRALAATATFIGAEGYAGVLGHELSDVLSGAARLDAELPLVVWAQEATRAQWGALGRALADACGARRKAVVLACRGPRKREFPFTRLGEFSGGAAVLVTPLPGHGKVTT